MPPACLHILKAAHWAAVSCFHASWTCAGGLAPCQTCRSCQLLCSSAPLPLSLSPPRRTTLASPSPRLCLAPACLPPATQAFLSRLKYDPCSHVDEFQAYLVTEKANFFGMDLGEAQERLAASFGPGAWR